MKALRYIISAFLIIILLSLSTLGTFIFLIPKAPKQDIISEEALRSGTYNILCVGIDKEETNADTIVLVSFNSIDKKVNLLSIPRDTMSNVNRAILKINASYGEGGIEATKKEVEMLTNLHIDRYITTTFDGFEHLIDALGGIDMEIPDNIAYQDTHQDLYINLEKGLHHLDGKEALHFVRFRYGYATGDIGRIGAQQLFFKALGEKITATGIISSLPSLANTIKTDMQTDLTIPEMFWFAKEGLKIDLTNDVHMFLLPGTSQMVDGLSYYIPSQNGILKMLNKFFIQSTEAPITAEKLSLVPNAAYVGQDFLTEGAKPTPKDENGQALEPEQSYNPYNATPVAEAPKPNEQTKNNIAK